MRILGQIADEYALIQIDSAILYATLTEKAARNLRRTELIAYALFIRGNVVCETGDYDSAIHLYTRARQAGRFASKREWADYQRAVGLAYTRSGGFDSALHYLRLSLKAFSALGQEGLVANVVMDIGVLHGMHNKIAASAKYFYDALQRFEKQKDTAKISGCYMNLSNLYRQAGDHRKSLVYALKCIAIREKIHVLDANTSGAYNNAGIAYAGLNIHDSAIYFYEKGIRIAMQIGNLMMLAKLYNNIADPLNFSGKPDSALKYLSLSVQYSKQFNNQEGVMYGYHSMSNIFLETRRYAKAIAAAKASDTIARQIGALQVLTTNANFIYRAHKALGNYKEALNTLEDFKNYDDSLARFENLQKMEALKYEHQINKQQQAIKDLSTHKELQERRIISQQILILVTAAFALVVLLFSIIYRREALAKRKLLAALELKNQEIATQSESLEKMNQLKNKVISVISHDVRSPISSLTAVIDLANNQYLSPNEQKAMLDELSKSVSQVSTLLENILGWVNTQLAMQDELVLRPVAVHAVVEDVKQLYSRQADLKGIKLVNLVPPGIQVLALPENLAVILRNLINNAIKYSFPSQKVTISCEQRSPQIAISVSDTGIGMDKDEQKRLFNIQNLHSSIGTNQEKGTGLGLILVKESVERLNGSLIVQSEKAVGTTFTMLLTDASDDHAHKPLEKTT